MRYDNKIFSPDFKKDIADLLEMCMKNKTDSITITFDYDNSILDIDMTFKVRKKEVK